MADSDDAWKRRREREKERDEEDQKDSSFDKRKPASVQRFNDESSGNLSTEQIIERMSRAEQLIEQLNNIYNMYVSGIERNPPIDRRKQLDELMLGLQLVAKPTQSLQFRFDTALSRFRSYRNRWDRLLRDLESGKIKRRVPGT